MMSPAEFKLYKEELKGRRKLKKQWQREKRTQNKMTKALRQQEQCANMGFCKFCNVKNPDVAHVKSRQHFQRIFAAMLYLGPAAFKRRYSEEDFLSVNRVGGRGKQTFSLVTYSSNQTLERAAKECDDYQLFCFRSGVANELKCKVCNFNAGTLDDWMNHVDPKLNHRETCQKELDRIGMDKYIEQYPTLPAPFLQDRLSTLPGFQNLRKEYPSRFDLDIIPTTPTVSESGQQQPATEQKTPNEDKSPDKKPEIKLESKTEGNKSGPAPQQKASNEDKKPESKGSVSTCSQGAVKEEVIPPPGLKNKDVASSAPTKPLISSSPVSSTTKTPAVNKKDVISSAPTQPLISSSPVSSTTKSPAMNKKDVISSAPTKPLISSSPAPSTTKSPALIKKDVISSAPTKPLISSSPAPSTIKIGPPVVSGNQQGLGKETSSKNTLQASRVLEKKSEVTKPAGKAPLVSSQPSNSASTTRPTSSGGSQQDVGRPSSSKNTPQPSKELKISSSDSSSRLAVGSSPALGTSTADRSNSSFDRYQQNRRDTPAKPTQPSSILLNKKDSFSRAAITSQPASNISQGFNTTSSKQQTGNFDRNKQNRTGESAAVGKPQPFSSQTQGSNLSNTQQSLRTSGRDFIDLTGLGSCSSDRTTGNFERLRESAEVYSAKNTPHHARPSVATTTTTDRQPPLQTTTDRPRRPAGGYYQQDLNRGSSSTSILQSSRASNESGSISKTASIIQPTTGSFQHFSSPTTERPRGSGERYYQQDMDREINASTAPNQRDYISNTATTSHTPTVGSFQQFSSTTDRSRGSGERYYQQDMGREISAKRASIDRGATAGISQPSVGYFQDLMASTTDRSRGSGESYYQQDMGRKISASGEATERDSITRTASISQPLIGSFQNFSSASTDRPRASGERNYGQDLDRQMSDSGEKYQPDMGREIRGRGERYYEQAHDKETKGSGGRYYQQDTSREMRGSGETYYQQDMPRDTRSILKPSRVIDERPDLIKPAGQPAIESRQEFSTATSNWPSGSHGTYYQQDSGRDQLPSSTLEEMHGVKRRRVESSQEYTAAGSDRSKDVSRYIPSSGNSEKTYGLSGPNYRPREMYDYKHEESSNKYSRTDFSTIKQDIDVNPSYERTQYDRFHSDYKTDKSDYMGHRNTRSADNTAELRYERGREGFPRDNRDRTICSPSRDSRRRVDSGVDMSTRSRSDNRSRSPISRSEYRDVMRQGDRSELSARVQTEHRYGTSRDANEERHEDRYYQGNYDRSSSFHPGEGRDDRDLRDTQVSRDRTPQSENTYYGYR